jgi:hypothetical protein
VSRHRPGGVAMGPQVSVPDIDFLLSIAADDAEWVAQMPCTDWRLPAGRPCRSGRDGNSLRGRRSNRSPGTAARIRSSRSHIELGAGDASACIGCSDRAEPGLRAAVDRSTKQLRAVVSALSAGGERPVTAGMPDARPLRSPTRTGIGSGPCSLSSTLGRCQRRLAGGVSGLTAAVSQTDPYAYEVVRLGARDDSDLVAPRTILGMYCVDGRLIGAASRAVLVSTRPREEPPPPPDVEGWAAGCWSGSCRGPGLRADQRQGPRVA